MAMLKVERIGGLAGLGGAKAHLKSEGEIAFAALSEADQKAVDALFKSRGKMASSPMRDGFSYRITRSGQGAGNRILVPEDQMPAALITCVKDRLAR